MAQNGGGSAAARGQGRVCSALGSCFASPRAPAVLPKPGPGGCGVCLPSDAVASPRLPWPSPPAPRESGPELRLGRERAASPEHGALPASRSGPPARPSWQVGHQGRICSIPLSPGLKPAAARVRGCPERSPGWLEEVVAGGERRTPTLVPQTGRSCLVPPPPGFARGHRSLLRPPPRAELSPAPVALGVSRDLSVCLGLRRAAGPKSSSCLTTDTQRSSCPTVTSHRGVGRVCAWFLATLESSGGVTPACPPSLRSNTQRFFNVFNLLLSCVCSPTAPGGPRGLPAIPRPLVYSPKGQLEAAGSRSRGVPARRRLREAKLPRSPPVNVITLF
ncbi:uncharacterized protein [Nyctibius grandis]|uniref:uncharacterized protein n=1 Tax=Nyctibius grandis TaxID=48427 RepID=UPI0035BC952F